MNKTAIRKLERIARSIAIDIRSTRIAMRMLPGMLREAAGEQPAAPKPAADHVSTGSYENVTGSFNLNGIEFDVSNATFKVDYNRNGGGLYFDWKGGEMKSQSPVEASGTFRNFTGSVRQGDAVVNCSDATFAINNKQGSTFIDWRGGVWHDGVFTNGMWHNGTWEDGEWYYGYWRKGDWQKGTQVIPKAGTRVDRNGNSKSVYVWDSSCKRIQRKTPPTKSYPVSETTNPDGSKFYSVGKNTDGGEWTKDDTSAMLDPSLFPMEAIDALNSKHMWGDTSHDGRNKFMQEVDDMWGGPNAADSPDIYRIYYNTNDKANRSLYVLYQNGYLKIFHLSTKVQTYQDTHKILKPASHRPASLKDLYMLQECEIFDGFVPTPDNMMLVRTHRNDGKFTDLIIQKAILVSKFKVFDPASLDRLFFVIDSGKSQAEKQQEIDKFKADWDAAIKKIKEVYKGSDAYLNSVTPEMRKLYNSLTAMEKIQLALKETSSIDKKNNLYLINEYEWKSIEQLNREVHGALTEANLDNWSMTTDDAAHPDPMLAKFYDAYDKIMDRLKNDATNIQQFIVKNTGK